MVDVLNEIERTGPENRQRNSSELQNNVHYQTKFDQMGFEELKDRNVTQTDKMRRMGKETTSQLMQLDKIYSFG